MTYPVFRKVPRAIAAGLCLLGMTSAAHAVGEDRGFLETVRRHTILTQTVPSNGDQNPYAIIVAPVSAGKVSKDDVLITNSTIAATCRG